MIDLVGMAERRLQNGASTFVQAKLPDTVASAADIAPIIRGALADRSPDGAIRRFVLDHRTSPEIRQYVDGAELTDYGLRGPVTPDHILRTKQLPLLLPAPAAGALDAYKETVREAVGRYADAYRDYFERNNARVGGTKTMLDPMPRLVLVPGVGLFAADKSAKDAGVTGDLAETMVEVTTAAEGLGRFTPLPEEELVRHRVLVARTGQAQEGERETASAPDRRRHRRCGRDRTGDSRGVPGGRRGGCPDRPAGQRSRPGRGRTRCAGGGRRRDGGGLSRRRVRPDRGDLRRSRHPGVECRRGLAGPDRRGRRGDHAPVVRAELLGPPYARRRRRSRSCRPRAPAAR